MAENNYYFLLQKLDEFTRKYYLNKIIRGILYTAAILISVYLIFSVSEYKFYFSTTIRKIIFYTFITGTLALIYSLIVNPSLKYFKLGKLIDYKTAALIIGTHFTEIQDKLLNILQLKELSSEGTSKELIEAGINQKIEKIKPVPFSIAINLSDNKKYLKYALPPLAVFTFILFAAPNILRESNYRLFKNNIYFEKKAPFEFIIQNKNLEVIQYDDYELKIKIDGEALPNSVLLVTENGNFTMVKNAADEFSYMFNNVPSAVQFKLLANGFSSSQYELNIIPKPSLLNFNVLLDYPAYTGKKNDVLKNTGDLLIPEGTNIKWTFTTENTNRLELIFTNDKSNAVTENKNNFTFSRKSFNNEIYKIGIANDEIYNSDTIQYGITVIPDEYPQINIQQFKDSTDDKYLYFIGDMSDDYGFVKLNFHYKIETRDASNELFTNDEQTTQIPFLNVALKNQFNYSFDLHKNNLKPGDRVIYYFEVWDNDGIHGPKATRSSAMQYIVPTIEELEQLKDKSNDDIKNSLNKVLDNIDDIQQKTEDIKNKFLEKRELSWEDKKQAEDLLKRQQNAQQQIENLQNEFKQNISMQQEYLPPDPEILEKQQQLENLFNNVLTDEMKKLMEELQQLMDKLNKEQSVNQMEEMQINNKQLKNELDRMLELFKQMEMEQKMQETIDKLNDLSQKEDSLSDKTDDKKSDPQKNIDNQQDIDKKFDNIQKDIDDLQKLNEDLQDKKNLENTDQEQQQIEQELQKSSNQLQQNNRKQASQSQKNASQQMKQMAQNMQNQMAQNSMQQQQEDMNSLKQLLDNLIKISVDQETLMKELNQIKINSPEYVDMMNRQQRIKDDSKLVEDSLMALSKRVFQISSFITREMTNVNKNLNNSLSQMDDRVINQANMYQQLTMTGYNNLALMLNEVMDQMQQQMAKKMPGSQMCQNPGGDSQLPTMGEMQKQLNEQLKKMKGEMENGEKTGNKQGMSKELAEMAAKQAAIREALQKMAEQLGGGNTDDAKLAKQLQQIADQMNKTEEDIVNKNLTQETLKRQKDILTRLLEADDAERQRKTDNERQSNTAKEISRDLPPALQEYLKKRNAEIDLYKTISPDLKPFYKNLVEDYFRSISYR